MAKLTDETSIAIIQTNVEYIKKDLAEIKQSVKELAGQFVTKQEYFDKHREVEMRMERLEKQAPLNKWIMPIISAVFSSVITFLAVQYLLHFP